MLMESPAHLTLETQAATVTSDLEAAGSWLWMPPWESCVSDKSEEDESEESKQGVGEAAYLVWTAVSSVVEQEMGRLTAAALSGQQRMFVSSVSPCPSAFHSLYLT